MHHHVLAGADLALEAELACLKLCSWLVDVHDVGDGLALGAVAAWRGFLAALALAQVQTLAGAVGFGGKAIAHGVDVSTVGAWLFWCAAARLFGVAGVGRRCWEPNCFAGLSFVCRVLLVCKYHGGCMVYTVRACRQPFARRMHNPVLALYAVRPVCSHSNHRCDMRRCAACFSDVWAGRGRELDAILPMLALFCTPRVNYLIRLIDGWTSCSGRCPWEI